MDGNNAQIDAVNALTARYQVKVPILIDFIHVVSYLWKAAATFFYSGDPGARAWVRDQAAKILDGRARNVWAGIRRRATTYGYSASEREGADACAAYLEHKQDYLDYPAFLAAGWPVASGLIEGAARWLIKDRMVFSSPLRVDFCPVRCQTVRAGYSWASYRLPRVRLSRGSELPSVPGGIARRPGVLDCGR